MYGYAVLRLRAYANGVPLVVDNLDGHGLDLGAEWSTYLGTKPNDTDLRARRFWEVTSSGVHVSGSPSWYASTVEYGPYGLRGRVRDTKGKKSARTVYVDDATVYPHRHLLHVPPAKKGALVASEVMGRARVYRKLLDAFVLWFEQKHSGITLDWDVMADDEFRQDYLDTATLLSVTARRQVAIPRYTDAAGSGESIVARVTTTVEPAGWGERFPGRMIRPLLEGSITPQAAFGLDFQPVETDLVVEAKGQRRTLHLDAGGEPLLLYPLGDPKRRSRPTNDEFHGDAEDTLSRLADALAS